MAGAIFPLLTIIISTYIYYYIIGYILFSGLIEKEKRKRKERKVKGVAKVSRVSAKNQTFCNVKIKNK